MRIIFVLIISIQALFSYYDAPPVPMPSTVEQAQNQRDARSSKLVKWWYKDYVNAGYSFGSASPTSNDGGLRSYRRIAAVLLTEGASAAAKVEAWTAGITSGRAGTPCGGHGDYDMKMKEMIALIYMFQNNPELLTTNAVYNIIQNGLIGYIGPTADKLTWPCVTPTSAVVSAVVGYPYDGTVNYPETENHVLMIESSRYLTNQWLYTNPRGDSRLSQYSYSDLYKNNETHLESILLQATARIVHGDAFEANGRSYQGLSATALLNLYSFANSEKIRLAAKNALDMMTTKFSFQSFEGKRFGPTRRNHEYANTLNMHEHDSFTLFMAGLSGGYVWNDDPDNINCFYNIVWNANYGSGNQLHQGLGQALWSSLSSYSIPESSHDFLLNKHNGYWAKFHPIHYTDEYRIHNKPDYFSTPSQRSINGVRMFAPESYFAHPKFMNVGGGEYNSGPLNTLFNKENRAYSYSNLARPMVVLTKGNYGAWADNVNLGDNGVLENGYIHRNVSNLEARLLNMQGNAKFWLSKYNYGVYKNFSYGYYYNQGYGAGYSKHTDNPWTVPKTWSLYSQFQHDRATFYIYNSNEGFFAVLARVSKSRDMDKYRNFARGFWEIIPSERFGNSLSNLDQWVRTNNPASQFQNTTSGEAKWFKYKMTSGETVWLDIIVGATDEDNDPIIRIYDSNGSQVNLSDAAFSRKNYANDPLINVRAVDSEFKTLSTKYAWSTGNGIIDINNPFINSTLKINSSNYTTPAREEALSGVEDGLEWYNSSRIFSKTAGGFRKYIDGSKNGGDFVKSDKIYDNQTTSFEFTTYISSALVFDWGVSSEANWDKLKLYVDGVEVSNISGEVIQLSNTVYVGAGLHNIKFEYSKDINTTRGNDYGWIDNLRIR